MAVESTHIDIGAQPHSKVASDHSQRVGFHNARAGKRAETRLPVGYCGAGGSKERAPSSPGHQGDAHSSMLPSGHRGGTNRQLTVRRGSVLQGKARRSHQSGLLRRPAACRVLLPATPWGDAQLVHQAPHVGAGCPRAAVETWGGTSRAWAT